MNEFLVLADLIARIVASSASWKTKYELIFRPKVSARVFELVKLDYYDPDTTYQEDVQAFADAVAAKAADIRLALGQKGVWEHLKEKEPDIFRGDAPESPEKLAEVIVDAMWKLATSTAEIAATAAGVDVSPDLTLNEIVAACRKNR